MNWIKINSEKDLPKEGKYVIAKHNRRTWIDEDDQDNVNTVVIKLIRGISEKERKEMQLGNLPDIDIKINLTKTEKRSNVLMFGDQIFNNKVPWGWESFGNCTYDGQEITHWMAIPDINE